MIFYVGKVLDLLDLLLGKFRLEYMRCYEANQAVGGKRLLSLL